MARTKPRPSALPSRRNRGPRRRASSNAGHVLRARVAGPGFGVRIILTEQTPEARDRVEVSQAWGPRRRSTRRGEKRRISTVDSATIRALAALGHPQRVRILCSLLEDPGTYRSLKRVTRLKAGPLYHHINQLRLAGLIRPKQRDLYALTRGGRNVVLISAVMGKAIRDTRPRP